MKEKLKELRINITVAALISIIIGLLLLIFPAQSISTIGKVIAIFIILAGLAVVGQMVMSGMNVMGIVVGAVIAIIGFWIFLSPAAILTIIPIAIGVMLVVHGVQDLSMAIETANAKADRAWISFILAVINIVLGFVCIANAFGFVNLAFRIIGIMLIYDGLVDLGIVHKVRKSTKGVVDSTITHEEDIF